MVRVAAPRLEYRRRVRGKRLSRDRARVHERDIRSVEGGAERDRRRMGALFGHRRRIPHRRPQWPALFESPHAPGVRAVARLRRRRGPGGAAQLHRHLVELARGERIGLGTLRDASGR